VLSFVEDLLDTPDVETVWVDFSKGEADSSLRIDSMILLPSPPGRGAGVRVPRIRILPACSSAAEPAASRKLAIDAGERARPSARFSASVSSGSL